MVSGAAEKRGKWPRRADDPHDCFTLYAGAPRAKERDVQGRLATVARARVETRLLFQWKMVANGRQRVPPVEAMRDAGERDDDGEIRISIACSNSAPPASPPVTGAAMVAVGGNTFGPSARR